MISFPCYWFLCLFLGTTDYFGRYDYDPFLYEVLSRYVSIPYSALMFRNLICIRHSCWHFILDTKQKAREETNGMATKSSSQNTFWTLIVGSIQGLRIQRLYRGSSSTWLGSHVLRVFFRNSFNVPRLSWGLLWGTQNMEWEQILPVLSNRSIYFLIFATFPRFLTGDQQNTNHYPGQTQEIDWVIIIHAAGHGPQWATSDRRAE